MSNGERNGLGWKVASAFGSLLAGAALAAFGFLNGRVEQLEKTKIEHIEELAERRPKIEIAILATESNQEGVRRISDALNRLIANIERFDESIRDLEKRIDRMDQRNPK